MSDLASIWRDAPCAALELRRAAAPPCWRLNRAAIEWSLDARLQEADWHALADTLLRDGAPAALLYAARDHRLFTAYVPGEKQPTFLALIERTFGPEITTRTWDTVRKLTER